MLNKKLESLKAYLLDMNYAELDELNGLTVDNCYNDSYKTFEIVGNEYKVLTDTEADEEAKENILNDLWAFNADFILQHTEFYKTSCDREDEAFISSLKGLQANGRGHFLSYYDGREHEQDEFYIYRTN